MNKSTAVFHCQVNGCLYSEGSERHFKSRKLLNQHFIKVHAEKKYVCSKCKKGFGHDKLRQMHEETCGIIWTCFTCKKSYSSRETLLTHERRTQHVVHSPHCPPLRKRKHAKDVDNHQAKSSVVIVFAGANPIVIPPSQLNGKDKVPAKCRQLLPKVPVNQDAVSASAIAALALSELALQSDVSTKKSVAVQTISTSASQPTYTSGAMQEGLLQGSSKVLQPQLYSCDATNFSRLSTKTSDKRSRKQTMLPTINKMAIETQTPETNILMQAMEIASIPVQTESRAAQCSPRWNKKQRKHESTHTQTTESTLTKLRRSKRGGIAGRSRKYSNTPKTLQTRKPSVSYESEKRSEESIEECVEGVLSRVNCLLFNEQSGEDLQRIEDLITHCSSATQTSSYLACLKGLCDSQTETDDFQQCDPANSLNINECVNMNEDGKAMPSINYEREGFTECLNQNGRNNDAYLPVFSRNETINLDSMCNSVHAGVNTNMQVCLNMQTQTDMSDVALLTENMEQSIQTELETLRLFSTIETQTVSDEDFDYPHVLTHMETQTTEDFFSSLELADIETQTAWEDISNLVSPGSADESCIQKVCASPSKQDSADFMDMETQTPFEFCGPELIDSYAQTLDLEFSSGLFNSVS